MKIFWKHACTVAIAVTATVMAVDGQPTDNVGGGGAAAAGGGAAAEPTYHRQGSPIETAQSHPMTRGGSSGNSHHNSDHAFERQGTTDVYHRKVGSSGSGGGTRGTSPSSSSSSSSSSFYNDVGGTNGDLEAHRFLPRAENICKTTTYLEYGGYGCQKDCTFCSTSETDGCVGTKQNKACTCLEPKDCWGCNVDGYDCLRLERSTPFGNLTICELGATTHKQNGDVEGEPLDIFGFGGSYTREYSNFATVNGNQANGVCSSFSPYSETSSEQQMITQSSPIELDDGAYPNAAYAKMHTATKNTNDVVGVYVKVNTNDEPSLDTLIDTHVFLGDNWVKTLDVTDRVSSREIFVPNFPRQVVPFKEFLTLGIVPSVTYVVLVDNSMENVLDFDLLDFGTTIGIRHLQQNKDGVPTGGVEFLCINEGATILLNGTIHVRDRVSFKSCIVDFNDGVLNLADTSSVIFQHSKMIGLDRCPLRYQEIDGVCYDNNIIPEQAEDAEPICKGEDGGYLPDFSSLPSDTEAFADLLLSGNEEVWISPFGVTTSLSLETYPFCTSLDSFGNEINLEGEEECSSFRGILCAVAVKEGIIGRNYSSYFSDQVWPNWYQASNRLIDPARLPIQTGGTVTIEQLDFRDNKEVDLFTVTDALPAAVKVRVQLSDSYDTSGDGLYVSLDSLPGAGTLEFGGAAGGSGSSGGEFAWEFDASDTLPSRLQVHNNGTTVCVSQVDLLLRNDTGFEHVAVSIPSDIFESCWDHNVCNSTSDNTTCGRSLMYYDSEKDCAVLGTGERFIPRDLSFNLYELSCGRLTTWHAEDLGEDMTIEIEVEMSADEEVTVRRLTEEDVGEILWVNKTSSDDHHYGFTASKTAFALQETGKLPTDFTVRNGTGLLLKSVKIQRYGLSLVEADFEVLFDCINLCEAIASDVAIFMDDVDTLYLELLETAECNKIPDVLVIDRESDEIITGREICSSPFVNATNVGQLIEYAALITPKTYKYRTIRVNIQEDSYDLLDDSGQFVDTVTVPPRRGMSLFKDNEVLFDSDACFANMTFVVEPLGELLLEDIVLKERTNFHVRSDPDQSVDAAGLLELTGCPIDTTLPLSSPFLQNDGHALLNSCNISGTSKLSNGDRSRMELVYSEVWEPFVIDCVPTSTILLSQMTLYENFSYPSTSFDCTVITPDASRFYSTVDDDEELCLGSETLVASEFLSLETQDCEALCEDLFFCGGFTSLFVDEVEDTQCAICNQESPCSYNCTEYESATYFVPESNFDYYTVDGCLTKTREYVNQLEQVSVEDCKQYCEFYKTCEGFRVEADGQGSRSCILYADLDLLGSCNEDDRTNIYLPFIDDHAEGFTAVQGTLTAVGEIGSYPDFAFDKCGALCLKTLECRSFVVDVSGTGCTLYDDNHFGYDEGITESNSTGLFVAVNSLFPKNRYAVLQACPLSDNYDSFNAKTVTRCQNRCDDDQACVAFIFEEFGNLFIDNCLLYDRVAVTDTVFPAVPSCTAGDEIDIHLAYMKESFISSIKYNRRDEPATIKAEFHPEWTMAGLIIDECKSLCLQEESCVAIRHDAPSLTCEIGTATLLDLDSQPNTQSETNSKPSEFLTLEARQADLSSSYLAVPGVCEYRAENIDVMPVLQLSPAQGYKRIERVCPAASSGSLGQPLGRGTPSECGLRCDTTSSCVGFVYYPGYDGLNDGLYGECTALTDLPSPSENCAGKDVLTDVYLRGDVGSTCAALCNVHQLCSHWVLNTAGCHLLSDVAIESECPDGTAGETIHIGLKYRERDALVKAEGQCLIDFEDLRLRGCYKPRDGIIFETDEDLKIQDNSYDSTTPFACQSDCFAEGLAFYAIGDVGNGLKCYCSSVGIASLMDTLPKTSCDAPCPASGDLTQTCGGDGAVSVGLSGLPESGLTLSQCTRACYKEPTCLAIEYDDALEACYLRGTAAYQACRPDIDAGRGTVYIESLEHYYQAPDLPYRGSQVLYTTTATSLQCGVLCDNFEGCEAMRSLDTVTVNNCLLLGGDVVPVTDVTGLFVAQDVTLFTRAAALKPPADDGAKLASFQGIFDLDECRALCDEHVECGSLTFLSKICTLYRFTAFGFPEENAAQENYYVGYLPYQVDRPELTEADGLCVSGSAVETRRTTLSEYECADRCRASLLCTIFTYNKNEKTCSLHDENVTLDPCPSSFTKTYILFNLGKFTLRSNGFLKDEADLKDDESTLAFNDQSLAGCSALCDDYFFCQSFRFDDNIGRCILFKSALYFSDNSLQASSEGNLYTYFSDFNYVPLPQGICVQSSSLARINDAALESCKGICQLTTNCVSFAITVDGDCKLYSSQDFSLPCIDVESESETVYIGYQYIFERSEFEYQKLNNCLDVTGIEGGPITAASLESCQESCSIDELCYGLQYNDATKSCYLLSGDLPPFDGSCPSDTTSFLQTKSNPYKEMEKTCLRNKIILQPATSNDPVPIVDTESYECQALCNAHPYCRYYIWGSDPQSSFPELRECVLFSAQAQELDNCENYAGDFFERTAYVNGRTFIDQTNTFGEPETTFAVIEGLSYQECASLCDSLTDQCNAFLHTWNYRRDSSASGEPLIFTKQRLIKADFAGVVGDNEALYLTPEEDGSAIVFRPVRNDADVTLQALVIDSESNVKSSFRANLNACMVRGGLTAIDDAFILDTLHTNGYLNTVPICEELTLGECANSEDIFVRRDRERNLRLFDPSPSTDEEFTFRVKQVLGGRRIVLEYEIAGAFAPADATSIATGCLRGLRNSNDVSFGDVDAPSNQRDYNEIPNGYQTLVISNITYCDNAVETTEVVCTVTQTRDYADETDTQDETDAQVSYLDWTNTSTVGDGCYSVNRCEDPVVTVVNSTTTSTVTECFAYMTEVETIDELNQTIITKETKTSTTCYNIQPTGLDLLDDMWGKYASSSSCVDSAANSGAFGRSYGGGGCGFDETLVTIPSELFDEASNPTILSNTDFTGCLGKTLDLGDCQAEGREEWVHLFFGGELFYTDSNGDMWCLTRSELSSDVTVELCDGTSILQSWFYNASFGLIQTESGENSECLICSQAVSTVSCNVVGDCSSQGARFVQYSECKLNTYTSTVELKVESIENPSYCIPKGDAIGGMSSLVLCDSPDAGGYKFYYDPFESRLEQVSPPGFCFGKAGDGDPANEQELFEYPTGLTNCSDLTDNALKVFWLASLGGENYNVLTWQQPLGNGTDENTDINTLSPTSRFVADWYCYKIPQSSQSECDKDTGVFTTNDSLDGKEAPRWKQFGSANNDAAVSVRPELLLQEITDPDLLFQFWLYTPDGKRSRILRARNAVLQRFVELILPFIAIADATVGTAAGLTNSVSDPVFDLNDKLGQGETFFGILGNVLIPFEKLAYVGPVLKAIRLRTISGQVKKACDKGGKGLDNAEKVITKFKAPLGAFAGIISELNMNLGGAMQILDALVEYVTRTSFCAFFDGFDTEFQRLAEWIDALLSGVTIVTEFVSGIESKFGDIDDFISFMAKNIFKPFNTFDGILKGIGKLIGLLDFVLVLGDVSVKIKKPRGFIKFSDYKITLEAIGKALEKFEKFIKDLPGVGWAWKKIEKLVSKVIGALFDFFGIDLPNFGLSLNPLAKIETGITEKIDSLLSGMNQLLQMIRIDGLLSIRADEISQIIFGIIPAGLLDAFNPDIGIFCDEDEKGFCIPDVLPLDLGLNGDLPSLKLDGIDISPPDDLLDILENFANTIESWDGLWDDLIDAGIECNEYSYLPISPVEYVEAALGVNFSMPSCDYKLQFCTSITLNGIDAFESKVLGLLQDVRDGVSGGSRNRALDVLGWDDFDEAFCRGPLNNWGLSIPLTVPIRMLREIFEKVMPLKNFRKSFNNQAAEAESLWELYWRYESVQNSDSTRSYLGRVFKTGIPLSFEAGPLSINLLGSSFSLQFGCDFFDDAGNLDQKECQNSGGNGDGSNGDSDSEAPSQEPSLDPTLCPTTTAEPSTSPGPTQAPTTTASPSPAPSLSASPTETPKPIFRMLLWAGPFLEIKIASRLPKSTGGRWSPTTWSRAELDTDEKKDTFDTQIEAVEDLTNFKCSWDFVLSTWQAYNDEKFSTMISNESALKAAKDDLLQLLLPPPGKGDFLYLSLEKNPDDLYKLAFRSDFEKINDQLRNKIVPKALKVRSKFQARYNEVCNDEFLRFVYELDCDGIGDSRYIFHDYVDTDCAGPERRTKFFDKSVKTLAKEWWGKIKDKANGVGGSDSDDSKLKEGAIVDFLGDMGFHPRSFGNLQGAGFDFSIHQETMNSGPSIESYEYAINFVGPLPSQFCGVPSGSTCPGGFEQLMLSFADMWPFGWLPLTVHLIEQIAAGKFGNANYNFQSVEDLVKDVNEAGNSKDIGKAIAARWGFSMTWSYGQFFVDPRSKTVTTDEVGLLGFDRTFIEEDVLGTCGEPFVTAWNSIRDAFTLVTDNNGDGGGCG